MTAPATQDERPRVHPHSELSELTVVLADGHPVVRSGLRALFTSLPGIRVAAEADTAAGAVRAALLHRPDVVVLDLDLGEQVVEAVRRAAPRIRTLVFTMTADDESIVAALRAGARGYLLKSAPRDSIVRAVRGVAAGEAVLDPEVAHRLGDLVADPAQQPVDLSKLTSREREVLQLAAAGMSNATIAQCLSLAPKTVSNHVSAILGKLRVGSRAEAIMHARRAGIGS